MSGEPKRHAPKQGDIRKDPRGEHWQVRVFVYHTDSEGRCMGLRKTKTIKDYQWVVLSQATIEKFCLGYLRLEQDPRFLEIFSTDTTQEKRTLRP